MGVFAPSDYVTKRRLAEGVALIKSWGLKVKYSRNLFERWEGFMAGTVQQRADDWRQMIFDDSLAAIWAAEGGYAATDIRWVFGDKEIGHLKKRWKCVNRDFTDQPWLVWMNWNIPEWWRT